MIIPELPSSTEGKIVSVLSIRDLFAALVMHGMIICDATNSFEDETIATDAYSLADAMLKAREHKDTSNGT